MIINLIHFFQHASISLFHSSIHLHFRVQKWRLFHKRAEHNLEDFWMGGDPSTFQNLFFDHNVKNLISIE